MKNRKVPELSIVILSFNTKEILKNCLKSLEKVRNELEFEVLVVDNASVDGSSDMVMKNFSWVKIFRNKINLGFAKGNNRVRNIVLGKYVLFLNSDTIVYPGTLRTSIDFLHKNNEIGVVSCRVELPDGTLDKDTRRAFINPWIGLTHLVLRLDRPFPKSRLFGRYWYGYIPDDIIQEVDTVQGAFILTRKQILDEVNWFDEEYFLDGEDIDLCWKIKKAGYFIYYYPKVKITHYKGSSKGKIGSKRNREVPLSDRLKYRMAGVKSMEIFYKKHLWSQNNMLINYIVLIGVKSLKIQRYISTIILG